MIKAIINGCNGAMGQVLTKIIDEMEDIDIVAGIDKNIDAHKNNYPVYDHICSYEGKADVVIDFSNPGCFEEVLEYGVNKTTPLVIATTGLTPENLMSLEEASKSIPIFHSYNTSLGVNVLVSLVKKAAAILSESFDIEIIEKHHNKKVDAPSGTAYMIANAINEELNNSMKFVYGREGKDAKRAKNDIGIHAVRGGTITGEHTVIFAGMDEIVEVKHTALSKNIFAQGAIKAAKYIINKDNGLYNMNDIIKEA